MKFLIMLVVLLCAPAFAELSPSEQIEQEVRIANCVAVLIAANNTDYAVLLAYMLPDEQMEIVEFSLNNIGARIRAGTLPMHIVRNHARKCIAYYLQR